MDIKEIASNLCVRHGTNDPFRIARNLGYSIVFTCLVGIRGFYQYINRCNIIYIDSSLDEHQARFVCAHELGHSLLHKKMNRIFMDTRTHMVTSRFEKEADKFAVDLIFDDYELQNLIEYSTQRVAECLGISYELAEYRMGSVNPQLYQ